MSIIAEQMQHSGKQIVTDNLFFLLLWYGWIPHRVASPFFGHAFPIEFDEECESILSSKAYKLLILHILICTPVRGFNYLLFLFTILIEN